MTEIFSRPCPAQERGLTALLKSRTHFAILHPAPCKPKLVRNDLWKFEIIPLFRNPHSSFPSAVRWVEGTLGIPEN